MRDNAEIPSPEDGRLLANLVVLACLLVVILGFCRNLSDGATVDYGEGPVLAMARRMAQEPVSMDWMRQAPYTLTCYGPLYYWMVRSGAKLFANPDSLLPGRWISLMMVVLTGALVAGVIVRHTRRLENGLFGTLVFLLSPAVSLWAIKHKSDNLAMLFSILAFVLATATLPAGPILAAICVVVGSLAKQTVCLMALPILLCLWMQGRRRQALQFAGLTVFLGALAWGILFWSSGGYFFKATVLSNLNRMSPSYGLAFLVGIYTQHPTSLLALLTVAFLWIQSHGLPRHSPLFVGFLVTVLIQGVLVCKEGANINYFLDSAALGAMLVSTHGLPQFQAIDARRTNLLISVAAPLLLAIAAFAPAHAADATLSRLAQNNHALVEQAVRDLKGDVLADGEHVEAVLMAGKTPYVNDPFLFRLMVEGKVLDCQPMLRAMEDGRIERLVLFIPIENQMTMIGQFSQIWPAEILQAMRDYYVLDTKAVGLALYRHK